MRLTSDLPVRIEGEPISARLPPNILAFAIEVGEQRYEDRRYTADHPGMGGPHPTKDTRQMDVESVVAECLGAFCLGLSWEGYLRDPDGQYGDVHGIEMKHVDNPKFRLRVQPHNAPHRPYCLVYMAQADGVGILKGWHWGWVVQRVALSKPREDKPATHFLENHDLRKDWQMLRVMAWATQGMYESYQRSK